MQMLLHTRYITAIQEKKKQSAERLLENHPLRPIALRRLILNATDTTFFKGEYVPFIWYLLAYLPVGLPVMREAWESILQKDVFSEFTLMSIATLGAFYIGEYPEALPSCSSTPWESSFRTKP